MGLGLGPDPALGVAAEVEAETPRITQFSLVLDSPGDEIAMNSDAIFRNVIDAMQPAEELEGPTEQEYIRLMERIAADATQRAAVCRSILAGDPTP